MHRSPSALTRQPFDLLILGGGITGAGVALDATLRGLSVALIDRGDFAGGTSSVSSKLVHGGLRYLEHAQFGLVQEALVERARLLRNAPHLVWPLRFLLPFYEKARVPAWKWRLGLNIYDFLAGRGNIRRSRPLSRNQLLDAASLLSPTGLHGGAEYHDAQMDDARLCLEVIRTAAREGAQVANYLRAVGFEQANGTISGVRAVDELNGEELVLRAQVVLNAAGPWVDEVCRLAGEGGETHLETTKGVHVLVPHQGNRDGLLLLHPADGRVFFVLPWLGKTLLGTTDTFAPQGPDCLIITPQDIAYLLAGYNHYCFPALSEGDLLGSFAGLRPLLRARSGEASARSREFRIFSEPSGLISAAGGKYTTYRSMAEQITDHIMRRLGRRERCRTQDYPLDGTPPGPWPTFLVEETRSLGAHFGLTPFAAEHLVRRYGRRAAEAAAYIRQPEETRPVVEGEPDMPFEFRYQRDWEMAVKPEDFLLRRTRLGLVRRDWKQSLEECL